MAEAQSVSTNIRRLAAVSAGELFGEFSSRVQGLTNVEVQEKQQRFGKNTVRSHTLRWWHIFARQFSSSFVYLLIGAGVLAYILGQALDGSVIILFVLINALLGFFQEFRSEQTVQMLNKYVVPRARIRRGGQETVIESTGVVVGDIVIAETGDVLPADLRLIQAKSLQIDESLLTGESAPVVKSADPVQNSEALPTSIGLSGTTVVSGRGEGVVIAIGSGTMLGEVTRMTAETSRESGFDKRLKRFSSFILRMTLLTLIIVFAANLLLKHGEITVTELVIFSIALAVSVIPEALPVVTTFALSRGASHLAKNHVVVKRLSAIEDLGSIEVLCTDKTGTLTENRLTLAAVHGGQERETLRAAGLASSFFDSGIREPNNAFDIALWTSLSQEEQALLKTWERVDELPFDPVRRYNSVVVKKEGFQRSIMRGAAEVIVAACGTLAATERESLFNWVAEEGRRGRRVIAVADKTITNESDRSQESGFHFLGLLSFVDPIKRTTKAATQQAQALGVRIKILTGDSPEVAGAVALEVGLVSSAQDVITGDALEALPQAEQHLAVDRHHVFARVSPQQKFRIIKLLEEKYEVGFLGEGINDAPALKSANVAIVVHEASDVAREAADIVLLERSLEAIVFGIKEGRAVFANTIKYIRATLASNFGNFYAIAIASLLVTFLPMLPLQILLVNLLSDFPMIAIAADFVDKNELARPKGYHIRDIALFAIVLGLVSTLFDFLYFMIFSRFGPEELRTYWFMGSIITELLFLFSVRTRLPFFRARRPSAIVLWLTGLAALVTVVLPFLPIAQKVFHFVQPKGTLVLLVLAIAAVYLVVSEIAKLQYFRFTDSQTKPVTPRV